MTCERTILLVVHTGRDDATEVARRVEKVLGDNGIALRLLSAEAVDRINSAPSGLQGLRDYFGHLVDAMVDGKRARGCLVTNSLVEFAARDPELAGMFQLHLARLQTSFAAALARARADGELRPGAGPEAAGMLVAVVQGMNVMAKSRPGRQALQNVVDAALAGLAAPPPGA